MLLYLNKIFMQIYLVFLTLFILANKDAKLQISTTGTFWYWQNWDFGKFLSLYECHRSVHKIPPYANDYICFIIQFYTYFK